MWVWKSGRADRTAGMMPIRPSRPIGLACPGDVRREQLAGDVEHAATPAFLSEAPHHRFVVLAHHLVFSPFQHPAGETAKRLPAGSTARFRSSRNVGESLLYYTVARLVSPDCGCTHRRVASGGTWSVAHRRWSCGPRSARWQCRRAAVRRGGLFSLAGNPERHQRLPVDADRQLPRSARRSTTDHGCRRARPPVDVHLGAPRRRSTRRCAARRLPRILGARRHCCLGRQLAPKAGHAHLDRHPRRPLPRAEG